MSDLQLKPKFYPLKPKNADGFKKAVAWFGGRELIASLKGTIMYAIYGENMDPRSWMKPNIYPNVEEKIWFQKVDKVKNKIMAEAEKSSGDGNYEPLNVIGDAAAKKEIKNSEEIQQEIIKKVNDEWAKKAFVYWEWKRTHFGFWEKYLETSVFWRNLKTENPQLDEFWFDFIADSGDGQMGVYGVGCMCFSDLWLKSEEVGSDIEVEPPREEDWKKYQLLPRGYFLFVGGDTAYHSANYATLFERFQTPFRWAFTSVRKFLFEKYQPKLQPDESLFLCDGKLEKVFNDKTKKPVENWDGTLYAKINENSYWDAEPPRPFFGIPANHDYYDSIDGFNRQFRRSPFEDNEENMIYEGNKGKVSLQIPTFAREQEASYIAIHLPFDWWMFGIDSENEKFDFRQEVFFRRIMEKTPKKLILATPEPTTVFGKKSLPAEKTTTYLKAITEELNFEQPYLTDGKLTEINTSTPVDSEGYCRLDLSGDVHHYARYWGENTRGFENERFSSSNYASLVSGGGGAFFDTTSTLIGDAFEDDGKTILRDKDGKKAHGEVPPQKLYPSEREAIVRTADKLFDLLNIKEGGYIHYAGAIFSAVIFFFLTQFSNVSKLFYDFNNSIKLKGFGAVTSFPRNVSDLLTKYEILFAGILLLAVIIFTGKCALNLNKLIKALKEKSFEEKLDQNVDGRIRQLIKNFIPLFIAVVLYAVFILVLGISPARPQEFEGFANSLFLLFHIIIALLLLWLSFEYTNWLAVRFKLTRKFTEKTVSEKFEDPNEKSKSKFSWLLKFLGKLSRKYSYGYFPAILLVSSAVVALIFGVGIFGKAELGKILADLTLVAFVAGIFVILAYILAYSTGAAYQDQTGKNKFLLIGLWHAVLQVFTAFILFYYAHWMVVLGIYAMVILFNGFSNAADRIDALLPKTQKGDKENWQTLRKIVNFRLGAWLMKQNKRRLLVVSWIIYGLIVLLTPFAVLYLFPSSETLNETIRRISAGIVGYFTDSPDPKFTDWLYIALSLLIVASIGYRMSRVWFSWYLGVSVLYNGHNNESGGMARIEDFKQILRIKVEQNKLTVFVIGLDTAQPNLDEKLKLKLVDKFELKCSKSA